MTYLFTSMRAFFSSTCVVFTLLAQYSDAQSVKPYYPTHQEVLQNYERARNLDSTLKKIPVNNSINPNWQRNNTFWYVRKMAGNRQEYFYVKADVASRSKAFNQSRLAEAIKKVNGLAVDSNQLNISKMFYGEDGKQITFKIAKNWFSCNLDNYQCRVAADTSYKFYDNNKPLEKRTYRWEESRTDSISPDKKSIALIKGGNIFIQETDSKKLIQFTRDGTLDKPYGNLTWAPDGKHFVAYRLDPKKDKLVYFVLSSVPGTTRGQLRSHEYAQPGDEFTTYTPFVFEVLTQKQTAVNTEKIDFFGAPPLHWRDNQHYTYEKVDRGHQRFRVIEVDVANGKTQNIIDEKTNTFIYEQRIYTHYLPKTNEIIWVTEQDGWRHIYLVNEASRKQQLITKGNWVVRDVDSVNSKKREIWFHGSGRNAGEDPYFVHYYRIGFDGKNLTELTPQTGNHRVVFSPDRKYFTDTYSQVNIAPVTELKRTADGKKVITLEQFDLKPLLATGIKMPEVFVAKARDGQTDIWGVVYRPGNFDNTKSYPVIENIYAGPQDSFVPKSFSAVNEMQNIAELGFIVVQIDGMGTANRSKAFHDVCWKNLADAGFPDRILWIKALAAKYPQIDISRIGIYGTSAGGQNSAGAVLFHPEFYKAAVSACGCHDNRIDKQWWNEQWMGYPVGPHYEQQSNITNAAKLKGNLLLIVGEADENVPPESTYRFADALIKNNKDFDFLTIPGANHTDGGPYGRRKKKDFFVRHLLHAEPPAINNNEQ